MCLSKEEFVSHTNKMLWATHFPQTFSVFTYISVNVWLNIHCECRHIIPSTLQSLKKLGYLVFVIGCSTSLYLWTYVSQYLINPTSDTIMQYWKWITGYVIAMGLISFGVVYKLGPITDPKSASLLQWSIQLIGLGLIYNGTQIREVSIALIVIVLFFYNLTLRLPAFLSDSKFFITLR